LAHFTSLTVMIRATVEYSDVRIMPLEIYRYSIYELADTTRGELEELFAELVDLPELDLSP